MARAWVEFPPDAGWGTVRVARTRLEKHLAYVVAELRGSGPVLLRLSGTELEPAEALAVPGESLRCRPGRRDTGSSSQ